MFEGEGYVPCLNIKLPSKILENLKKSATFEIFYGHFNFSKCVNFLKIKSCILFFLFVPFKLYLSKCLEF